LTSPPGRATHEALDAEAWKRGDPGVVGEVAASLAPTLWRIARRGFVCNTGPRVVVRGLDEPADAERLVISVLTELCAPAARAAVSHPDALRTRALALARSRFIEHAMSTGAAVSAEGDAPEADTLDDLDAIVEGRASLREADPPVDFEREQRSELELSVMRHFLASLDAQTAQLVRLRFVEGRDPKAIALVFDCGAAAVRARERLVRRELRTTLRQAGVAERRSDAAIDGLFLGAPLSCELPAVTRQRLCREVQTRTFQEEPPPYSTRLAWGLGALGVAMGLWAAMFFGVLPSPESDPRPRPELSIECKTPCAPGVSAEVFVRAPQDARTVAVILVDGAGQVWDLLTDPGGRSISLPLGARDRRSRLPYLARLPEDMPATRAEIIAVFADRELSPRQLEEATSGSGRLKGVLTASTSIALAR
jgi:DNA-directed RNA polymerase specialized sigma24 family protein